MDYSDFVFWVIPDLAIVPNRSYLIYKKDDRTIPIAHIVCSEDGYDVKATPDLKLGEQLALHDACEKFYKERYGGTTEL